MPVTTLDRTCALVIVDLQVGTLANAMAHPVTEVVAAAGQLVSAFRRHGLPVAFAYSTGTPDGRTSHGAGGREWPAGFASPVPDLGPRPDELVVPRRAWSAFADGALAAELARTGTTQLVVAGVATSFGVESTARAAYDLGHHVAVATDAVTDLDLTSHEHSVTRVLPMLGEVGTAAEVVELLDLGATGPGSSRGGR